MAREPGFYWVSTGKRWVVAEWVIDGPFSYWNYSDPEGNPNYGFSDEEYAEIDECRLIKGDGKTW